VKFGGGPWRLGRGSGCCAEEEFVGKIPKAAEVVNSEGDKGDVVVIEC